MELVDKLKNKLKQLNRWSLILIFLFLLLFSLVLFVVLRTPSNDNERYSSHVNGVTSKLIRIEDELLFFQNTYYISVNYSSNAYIDQTYSMGLHFEVFENELNYSLYLSRISIKLHFLDSLKDSNQIIYSIFPEVSLSLDPIYIQEISFTFAEVFTGNWILYLVFSFPEPSPEIDEQVIIPFPITVFEITTFDKVISINSLMIILPAFILITLLRQKRNCSN